MTNREVYVIDPQGISGESKRGSYQETLYHGTDTEFDTFELKEGWRGVRGLTTDLVQSHAVFLTDSIGFASERGSRVLQCSLVPGLKILDLTGDKGLRRRFQDAPSEWEYDEAVDKDVPVARGDDALDVLYTAYKPHEVREIALFTQNPWEILDVPEVVTALKDAGFHGVKFEEGGEDESGITWAIFNPQDIKIDSVIGKDAGSPKTASLEDEIEALTDRYREVVLKLRKSVPKHEWEDEGLDDSYAYPPDFDDLEELQAKHPELANLLAIEEFQESGGYLVPTYGNAGYGEADIACISGLGDCDMRELLEEEKGEEWVAALEDPDNDNGLGVEESDFPGITKYLQNPASLKADIEKAKADIAREWMEEIENTIAVLENKDFPEHSEESLEAAAERLGLPEDSETVRLFVSGDIDEEEALRRADIISARHDGTNYDNLLSQGYTKEEARDAIQEQMGEILDKDKKASASKTANETLKSDSIWKILPVLQRHKMISQKKVEREMLQSPRSSYAYAYFVLEGRFELGEPVIAKDPSWAYFYASEVLKPVGIKRFELAEPTLAKDPEFAFRYARNVLKGRWEEAEPTISQDPKWAFKYALEVLQPAGIKRFELGEPVIAQFAEWATKYATDVLRGRFELAEPTIAKDPRWASYYVRKVLITLGLGWKDIGYDGDGNNKPAHPELFGLEKKTSKSENNITPDPDQAASYAGSKAPSVMPVTASKPITLPTKAVQQVKDIVMEVLNNPPASSYLMDTSVTKEGPADSVDWVNAKGDLVCEAGPLEIIVQYRERGSNGIRGKGWKYVLQASTREGSVLRPPVIHFIIDDRWLTEPVDVWGGVQEELASVAAHELTHLFDPQMGEMNADYATYMKNRKVYVNAPNEIRAHLQQMAREIRTVVRNNRERVSFKEALEGVITWRSLEEHLTEDNRKKVLKALAPIYQEVREEIDAWRQQKLEQRKEPVMASAKTEPEYVYHATHLGKLESIAAHGLLPSGESQFNGGYTGHSQGRVFFTAWEGVSFWLTKMEDIANHNSDFKEEEDFDWIPVVIRAPWEAFQADPQHDALGHKDSGGRASWFVAEQIDPDWLEVWDGSEWVIIDEVDTESLRALAIQSSSLEHDPLDVENEEEHPYWNPNFAALHPAKP